MQLEVTPQITPDNRIIMDLLVSQDSVGAFTPTGEPSIDITQIETRHWLGMDRHWYWGYLSNRGGRWH